MEGGSRGRGRRLLGTQPSEAGLGLGDVDLDAVRPLRGRVLPEGGGPLGGHQPPPGLLPLAVLEVQGALPRHAAAPLRRPLRQRRRRPLALLTGGLRERTRGGLDRPTDLL